MGKIEGGGEDEDVPLDEEEEGSQAPITANRDKM
jgi:hypothetical protein